MKEPKEEVKYQFMKETIDIYKIIVIVGSSISDYLAGDVIKLEGIIFIKVWIIMLKLFEKHENITEVYMYLNSLMYMIRSYGSFN